LRQVLLKANDRQRYHFGHVVRAGRAGRQPCSGLFCQRP
jgi:hypothetical protein